MKWVNSKISYPVEQVTSKQNTDFYDSRKGHVGAHYHHGIAAGQTRYDAAADAKLSDCVVYASTNSHSTLCEHCSVAAKKQDINSGWPAL
jgi:hypothetical protein